MKIKLTISDLEQSAIVNRFCSYSGFTTANHIKLKRWFVLSAAMCLKGVRL